MTSTLRILMVSPHPTYSPRGTPISVLNRCHALSALGHQVDLVTYGIGQDVEIRGLRWLRSPVPGIKEVKIGPSPAKVPLNIAVFLHAAARAIFGKYDVIHTHEESGILGAFLSRLTGLRHVYDMGNDLSVVMTNYGFSSTHPLTRLAVGIEKVTVRRSDVVIAHFPVIADRVRDLSGARSQVQVVPNVPLELPAQAADVAAYRAQWSADGAPILFYAGSFEDYQGLPAMIEAMALLKERGVTARFVVAGGRPDQQAELTDRAQVAGVSDRVAVVGMIDQSQMSSCLQAADILVSPRAFGSNTPLKLFSYMHSGRPILATDIASHTQVLNADSAELVDPGPQGLADGAQRLLTDPARARRLAEHAQSLAVANYSVQSYIAAVAAAYVHVGGVQPDTSQIASSRRALEDTLIGAAS